MTLRKSLLALTLCLFALSAFAVGLSSSASATMPATEQAQKMTTHDFSKMSVRQVEELTGHKLSLKEKLAFKVLKMKAKKMQKKASTDLDQNVYIILAIFIPFVAVGLASDWEGNDWLICLLLSCIFWIPGIIFAFIKMGDYYG